MLRSVSAAYRFEAAQRGVMQRLLTRLDGTRNFDALLANERPAEAFFALRVLDDMAQCGVLEEGPLSAPATAAGAASPTLLGLQQLAPSDISVRCLETADLQLLEAYNRQAHATKRPYLPVFPFGDALLVGPVIEPGKGPCLRCFELRWLGISQTVEAERAYFELLRAHGSSSSPSPEQLSAYASLAAPVVAERLARRDTHSWTTIQLEPRSVVTSHCEAHPRCELCSRLSAIKGPPSAEVWKEEPLSLVELAERLEPLAQGTCAIANITPPPRGMLVPTEPLAIVVSRFAFPEPAEVSGAQSNFAHGSAPTPEAARTLAIVEALERYSGLLPPPPGLEASYESLAGDALLPSDLPLFSAAQYATDGFPFQPFSPEQPLRWCWGYNLTRARRVLVPVSAAYYGYDDALLGECSSGVAAHSSRGHALLNGLYELVERDAFMIHWLNRLSPPQLDLEHVSSSHSRALVRAVVQSGYAPHLLDLTTDLGIPVVLALGVRTDRKKPALLVGAGASLDPHVALERALSELFSATCSKSDQWSLRPAMAASEVRALSDHSRAYEHPDWLEHAEFLWQSSQRSTPPVPAFLGDFRVQLATLVARLEGHGHDVIGVDITAPDVGRYGLYSVRAIAPGLQPLALGPGPRLGGRRWSHAPLRMGRLTAPTREQDIYQLPHCFP